MGGLVNGVGVISAYWRGIGAQLMVVCRTELAMRDCGRRLRLTGGRGELDALLIVHRMGGVSSKTRQW